MTNFFLSEYFLFRFASIVSLLPVIFYSIKLPKSDIKFWLLLFVALLGLVTLTTYKLSNNYLVSFNISLLIIASLTTLLFIISSLYIKDCWRLTSLLMPYIFLLTIIAAFTEDSGGFGAVSQKPELWLFLHIMVSLLSYAFLTLAAVSGLSVFFREKLIKVKKRNDFFKHLPSIVDGERIEILFLIVAFTCLTLALLTGMSLEYYESGKIFVLNHKNLFSYFTFLVIAILFAYRKLKGARGKRAARIVLLSYLFLTLAYPGVKFVQFVLIS